jgi:hypothetical protein
MNKNEILFDRRTVERNLRQGGVTRADYQGWLKSLPDRAKEVEWVDIEALASRSYLRGIRGADPAPEK